MQKMVLKQVVSWAICSRTIGPQAAQDKSSHLPRDQLFQSNYHPLKQMVPLSNLITVD